MSLSTFFLSEEKRLRSGPGFNSRRERSDLSGVSEFLHFSAQLVELGGMSMMVVGEGEGGRGRGVPFLLGRKGVWTWAVGGENPSEKSSDEIAASPVPS